MIQSRVSSIAAVLAPESLGYRARSLWTLCSQATWLAAIGDRASRDVPLVVIAAAPWLTAGIQPWSIYLLAAASTLAFVGLLLWLRNDSSAPRPSRAWWALAVVVVGALAIPTLSVFNATNAWNPAERALVSQAWPSRWMPSSVHPKSTVFWLIQVAPTLALLLVMAYRCRVAEWRRRALACLAGGGAALAAYGVVQHLGLLPPLATQPTHPRSVFATFDYHGNAGAFLNLALPAAIALSLTAADDRGRRLWRIAAAAIVAGAMVNISKAASLLTILLLAAALAGLCLRAPAGGRRAFARRLAIRAIAPTLAVLLVAGLTGRWRGWAEMPRTVEAESGRRVMWRMALAIAGDSGAFGHGAGSFKLIVPTSRHLDPRIYTRWAITRHVPGGAVSQWSYPCCDALQSWIEVGPIGTLAALALPAGAAMGLARRWRGVCRASGERVVVAAAMLALGVVAVHSVGDFPLQILSIQIATCVYLGIGWSMLSGPRDAAAAEGA